jgi:hypothetical protein
MSQLVKTKRQANFKDFKRYGAFKGLVEQKNVVFNLFVCKLGGWAFFGTGETLKRSFHSSSDFKRNQNSGAICRFYLTFDNSWMRSIKIRKVVIVFNILI